MNKNTNTWRNGLTISLLTVGAMLSGCMMEPGDAAQYEGSAPYDDEQGEVVASTAALHNSSIWNNPNDAIGHITDGETTCLAFWYGSARVDGSGSNIEDAAGGITTGGNCFADNTPVTFIHPTRGTINGIFNANWHGPWGQLLSLCYHHECEYDFEGQKGIPFYRYGMTEEVNENMTVRMVGGNRQGISCSEELPERTITTATVLGLTTFGLQEHTIVGGVGRNKGTCDDAHGGTYRGGPLLGLIGGRWYAIGLNIDSGLETQDTGAWLSKFSPSTVVHCRGGCDE